MNNRDKWLITIDLDGTFLNSSKESGPNYSFNEKNLKIVKQLIKKGHKVAIVTGRPWRDAKPVYEKMGLSSVIANYNGAHIHHPNNDAFVDLTFSINKEILKEVLDEEIIKKSALAYVIDTIGTSYYKGTDGQVEDLFRITGTNTEVSISEFNYESDIKQNPQSGYILIDDTKVNPYDILHTLKRKYGNSMFFRLWDGRTSEKSFVVLEINQIASNKGSAMEYIAAYYNIPKTNTIAFGDGLNDREMLIQAGHGVAMKNAKGTVKTYADDTTDFTNDEAGVGMYLKDFFNI